MRIRIVTLTGIKYFVDIENTDLVKEVKEKLSKQLDHNICAEIQTFIFNKQKLDNERAISDYGIQDNDTIFLIIGGHIVRNSVSEN